MKYPAIKRIFEAFTSCKIFSLLINLMDVIWIIIVIPQVCSTDTDTLTRTWVQKAFWWVASPDRGQRRAENPTSVPHQSSESTIIH